MNTHAAHIISTTFAALLLAVTLAACQSAPPRHAMLDQARVAVAKARSDPGVVRMAPTQLEDAELALRRAETASDSGRDAADVQHLAYLALQRVAIADHIAASRVADARTKQALAERDSLHRSLVAARAAERQAVMAQNEAQSARARTMHSESLRRQLALLQGRETARGTALMLGDDLFVGGREMLRGRGERMVGRIADVMQQHPERLVLLQGAAATGGAQAGADLPQRRALALRDALIARGVAPDRIKMPGEMEMRGYGGAEADQAPMAGGLAGGGVEVLFLDTEGRLPQR